MKALFVLFPLWWVLGLGVFIFPLMAVPMLAHLRKHRPLRFPPYFWMLALYTFWQVLSLVMYHVSPPGTHASAGSGRLISIVIGFVEFLCIVITLLYTGNLSREEVSQQDIGRWMGWFFLTVVAGGFLGIVDPRFQFRSAIELVLPRHYTANLYVKSLVHPIAAQVQDLIGQSRGRPAAPFGYTNSWGNCVSILMLFFVAAWVIPARSWRRGLYASAVGLAFVPIVYSLNRGLWIGVVVTVAWIAVRQLMRGRVGMLAAVGLATAIGIGVFFATPAHTIVSKRLDDGSSNSIRFFVARQSFTALINSPVLGYGGTRHANGSSQSVAIGKSASCAQCGDVATGSTGQLWAIMFNEGGGGLLLFYGFLIMCLWTYRRERTAMDEAALCSIALVFVYMFFYNTFPVAPTFTVIAVALLWRSKDARLGRAGSARLENASPVREQAQARSSTPEFTGS